MKHANGDRMHILMYMSTNYICTARVRGSMKGCICNACFKGGDYKRVYHNVLAQSSAKSEQTKIATW
jgi:hypothetical protein